ncbi:hypothetical protein Lesp01_81710 [Lentzea sp. NBRC 102530]|nr:hypothetical protein Lesp01_81710 [Lentzea sp. NBRC 102530]
MFSALMNRSRSPRTAWPFSFWYVGDSNTSRAIRDTGTTADQPSFSGTTNSPARIASTIITGRARSPRPEGAHGGISSVAGSERSETLRRLPIALMIAFDP